MKLVTISNGLLRGQLFEGTYPLAREFKAESWAGKPREGKVMVVKPDGKTAGVWVDANGVAYSDGKASDLTAPIAGSAPIKKLDPKKIAKDIEHRFSVMNKMTDAVVKGRLKGMILAGAPGVGKTYELEEKLSKAFRAGDINYVKVGGAITGKGLYELLWEHKEKNDVVVLDDCDRIFGDEDGVNVLKHALDTGDKRTISWMTASGFGDSDIPKSFVFRGSIIFISNLNFDNMAAGNTKMAPHIKALLSRSLYLDLGVHTNEEIMIRIEQVVKKADVLEGKDVSEKQKTEILKWVRTNHKALRSLSIRTVLHIADLVQADPKNWKEDAKFVLLDPRKSASL